MSPVSSRKCSDRGARVQAPFTLSDTRTCAEAPYCENHPTSRSPWATGAVSVTVVDETRDPVENAAPWTKVGVIDWAPAVTESRTPSAAITARRAPDRAEGKCFTVIHSFTSLKMGTAGTRPGFDFTPCGPEVAFRKLAIIAPAPFSPPSRLAPHAFRMRDAVSARRGARPRRLFGYATTQRYAEAIASLERCDELKPAVPAVRKPTGARRPRSRVSRPSG